MRRLFPLFLLISCFLPGLAQVPETDSLSPRMSYIEKIIITGNVRTRTYIIERELTFRERDSLPAYVLESALERSRQNLMNTALFNFADIRYFRATGDAVIVHIDVTERWYLWPMPVFEIADRNFNEWWLRKDLGRTNYGINLRQENLTGRDDILQVTAISGYTRRIGFSYIIPYINRKLNTGLTVGFYKSQQHETVFNTDGNKLQFFNDPDAFVRKELNAWLRLTKRKGLYHYYNTTIDYRKSEVTDSVIRLNPLFFTGGYPLQQHLAISWSYRFDKRDYQPYALRGHLFEIEVNKTGMGLLKHEPNLLYISSGLRLYQPISKRWFASMAIKGRITQLSDAPFFNQRALGYGSDYIRGYDLYVMNGQNFALFRSALKFNLLPTKVYLLPVISTARFSKLPLAAYLNVFADAGYVVDPVFSERNFLSNRWQYGYGMSADVVTYYDIVLRFEYAFNRVGDRGFYFRIGSVF